MRLTFKFAGSTLQDYAQFLGYAASMLRFVSPLKELTRRTAGLVVVQWTPQLYQTYKTRQVGSLSLLMLAIQVPGAFLVVIFQAISGADWTTVSVCACAKLMGKWVPYVFGALEQIALMVLIIIIRRTKTEHDMPLLNL